MIWGVDSATPGNPARLKALGYTFAMGYIGGSPGSGDQSTTAQHIWLPADWQAHAAAGLSLGPIFVGPLAFDPGYETGVQDGNLCLIAMQRARLSGLVWIDVENGLTPREWYRGLMDSLHAGDASGGLYGSAATISALGGLADRWWLAHWVQSGSALAPAPPDWSMWQYATGPQFDYNVATDDCPFATYNP